MGWDSAVRRRGQQKIVRRCTCSGPANAPGRRTCRSACRRAAKPGLLQHGAAELDLVGPHLLQCRHRQELLRCLLLLPLLPLVLLLKLLLQELLLLLLLVCGAVLRQQLRLLLPLMCRLLGLQAGREAD